MNILNPTLTRAPRTAALQIHASESKPGLDVDTCNWKSQQGHMSTTLTQFAQTGHEPRALGKTVTFVGWGHPDADARWPLGLCSDLRCSLDHLQLEHFRANI